MNRENVFDDIRSLGVTGCVIMAIKTGRSRFLAKCVVQEHRECIINRRA
jgi:hypothetical protein